MPSVKRENTKENLLNSCVSRPGLEFYDKKQIEKCKKSKRQLLKVSRFLFYLNESELLYNNREKFYFSAILPFHTKNGKVKWCEWSEKVGVDKTIKLDYFIVQQ